MKTATTLGLSFGLGLFAVTTLAQPPAERYASLCASCHSESPAALAASAFVTQSGDTQVADLIRNGRPMRGMPAFAATLPTAEAHSLAAWIRTTGTQGAGTMIGRRIEAEDLRADRSSGYDIAQEGQTRFLRYVDRGSHLCYDNLDLTGVKSIEYSFAKGDGEPPRRFALVAYSGEFANSDRVPLGEKITPLTGGWATFRTERLGFARELTGRHRLCIVGLGGGGVFNLDHFTLSDVPGTHDGITPSFSPSDAAIRAGGHSLRLQKIADIEGEMWSLDFLDERTLIATQKTGALWLFRGGKRIGPIADIPEAHLLGQGGLLTVRVHPDYRRNGWVYLTYTEAAGDSGMLTIVRGRIRENRWVDQQTIYRAAPEFFSTSGAHFGGRLAFDGDYLFFGIGDRGNQEYAQDPSNPFGKIHRLFADGRVPSDNPFVNVKGAIPTIWSLGHRNPQGLFVDAARGLWATEHGPKGGDELNWIERGRNYGWPLVTKGVNYDGTPVSPHQEREGFESPRANWNPSPGLSNLVRYEGQAFPGWRHRLLVACLAQQQLKLIRLENNRVVAEEILLEGIGRIRDVIVGPDGLPYIAVNYPHGQIFSLVPAKD